jgi:hypothetical protein
MSIEETNQVDFTSVDKAESRVQLSISDHLPWDRDEGEHLLLLQEKLNTYLAFIEGGQMVETYPWTKGLPVVISIYGKYPLSPEATRFFNLAKGSIENAGFDLEFKLHDRDQASSNTDT